MPLTIDTLSGPAELHGLRQEWEQVYCQDQDAQIFMSWSWLSGWLAVCPYPWQIIRVRSRNIPMAFLVISEKTGKGGQKILQMGGSPQADYTGILCRKGYETSVYHSLASFLKVCQWDILDFRDLMVPPPPAFTRAFEPDRFFISLEKGNCCPFLQLPEKQDNYLKDFLSSGTRQSLLRKQRRLYGSGRFCIKSTTQENFNSQAEALIRLWKNRFGRGDDQTPRQFYAIHKSCMENNILWLDILWSGHCAVAALSAFLDHHKNTFRFYIMGFNPDFARFSPGKLMVLHAVGQAIEMGFSTYDFMRGDESYKYSFGALKKNNTILTIRRKSSLCNPGRNDVP